MISWKFFLLIMMENAPFQNVETILLCAQHSGYIDKNEFLSVYEMT